jgi:hypothetical protein
MSDLKTQKTKQSVTKFLAGIEHEQRRKDCRAVVKLMREVTGEKPAMWGPSIIGFGSYHYKYASGREGDWFLAGVSPRKQNLSIYVMPGLDGHAALLKKLGKHKTGKACLYVNTLEDIDLGVLRKLIETGVERLRKTQR